MLQVRQTVSVSQEIGDIFVITTTLLMTFLYPDLSNAFYVLLLSIYTLMALVRTKETSNLALASILTALVGFNLISLRVIPNELATSYFLLWPLFLFGIIACLSEKSMMLLSVLVAVTLNLEVDSNLVVYATLGVFVIELMSSQKKKVLQTAVLLGLVISPFHLWGFVALGLICMANQFKQNAEILRSFAAILSLFSCLASTNSAPLILIVFLALLYILSDRKRLESLC